MDYIELVPSFYNVKYHPTKCDIRSASELTQWAFLLTCGYPELRGQIFNVAAHGR